ncbi:MAG: S24/S26 family peptidase [Rikenellaceae bacterium]|nr:S24/S26 family peptidase [Rikenellaceae bacterium]
MNLSRLSQNEVLFAEARRLLAEGRSVRIRVQGDSMLPFLRNGQQVTIRPLRDGACVRGAVLFGLTDRGGYVIHRAVSCDASTVTLMGDGNCLRRERIDRQLIFGYVESSRASRFAARLWYLARPVRRVLLPLVKSFLSG